MTKKYLFADILEWIFTQRCKVLLRQMKREMIEELKNSCQK